MAVRAGKALTPTLATGIPNSRSRGFTLIEILVVVVVVAITVSIALLSINVVRDDRDLETEAQRFAALLEVALDDATLQGREFGIELMRQGYRFVEYDTPNDIWVDFYGDDTLRDRKIPEAMEFELYIEDKRVLLDDYAGELDDPDTMALRGVTERYAPHLLLFSSGETTPFELHIVRPDDDQLFIVRGDALGAIEFGEEELE